MQQHLIDPEHRPGILERNKDVETQEQYIVGNRYPENSNSRLLFGSASKIIKKGWKEGIQREDLWRLDEDDSARGLWTTFEPIWSEELKKSRPSLVRAVVTMFRKQLTELILIMAAYSMFAFVNPVILPFLIDYVTDFDTPAYAGYVYIICIIISQLAGSFCFYYSSFKGNTVGIDIRSLLAVLVYRKSLTMAPQKDLNSGQIANLISGEAFFLADTFQNFVGGLAGPFQAIFAIVLLAVQVQYFVVILVGLLVIFAPTSFHLGHLAGNNHREIAVETDKRLKLTNELLQGIRIVKYYAWENAFKNNIESKRDGELKYINRLTLNRGFAFLVMQNVGSLGMGLTLIFYGLFGSETLDAPKAFSIVSIFNLTRQTFILLPITVVLGEMYMKTFIRIQSFVVQPDIKPVAPLTNTATAEIDIKEASFKYSSATQPILKNFTFNAKKGDLVMVVGSVGSGKSSVISAILGELPTTSGSLAVSGSIAYVAQEAFIFNSTVRENILFGKEYDPVKYRQVLEASALMADLSQFTAGDRTEIGERGVNLSGGQKQRISIARALYSNNDIVLLDDPLSAVDSHVGKHIFHRAVKTYLADKLVILTANQVQYLPFADKILFLDNEEVHSGTFEELMAKNTTFNDQMTKFGVTQKGEEPSEEEPQKPPVSASAQPQSNTIAYSSPVDDEIEQSEDATDNKRKHRKMRHKKSRTVAPAKLQEREKGALIVSEEKKSGLVGFGVYWFYFKKGGLGIFFVLVLLLALSVGSRIVGLWWLSVWTSNGTSAQIYTTTAVYIGVFAAFIGTDVLSAICASFVDVVLSTRASKALHLGLLGKIIRAPTSFFDVTPLGRIVNRFAKELNLVDKVLPLQLYQYLTAIFTVLSVFASMAFASPYFVIAIAVVIIGYYFFQWYFRKTYVETQRMEALSRAPLFSQLGETLRGAATIRAYRKEDIFRNVNYYNIDANSTERIAQKYLISWFGLCLDCIGTGLVLILMVLIVSLRITAPDTLVGGFAALALANTSGLTSILSTFSFNSVETEAKMNSVERLKEYEVLPQEAPDIIEENRPPKDWPQFGEIKFNDASLRYRPEGEMVLKQLNLTVQGEEKVGIVGRTGAGKSTLLQALFRIVELAEGSIEIDGIDISKIGLTDLRSKLSIIPQEPVLFLGTVRYNLDPFGEHSDQSLWEVLQLVNLKFFIESLPGGLDATVEENGANFSVGQRQLICMARALLRKTKILFMDEATASVDLSTDLMIQTTVRKYFSDRTTLTIAHRLNTVMDSTKVLVLNRGELIEYAPPAKLLEKPDGHFTSMVNATGPEQSEFLRKIARGEIGVVQSLNSFSESQEDSSSEE
eukprot:TRINITY_DN5616_c1_g1_i1.p1 TRINITY_DN5616_c1_g1~~TRINITY_DN5616_c1_g1_i1.p1  ORF type:complete len:1339 (+),score=376.87 TRINITY_DN5616_c1_g1_i1:80-4096(+)